MRTVYKYPLEMTDVQKVAMPNVSKILSVQFQNGQLCLWVDVATESEMASRTIVIVGTGNPIESRTVKFIGTAQDPVLGLVWHVYEGY